MLIYCLMNTLAFTHPTKVATQTFDNISTAMGDRDYFDMDNTKVRRTSGKVSSCLSLCFSWTTSASAGFSLSVTHPRNRVSGSLVGKSLRE